MYYENLKNHFVVLEKSKDFISNQLMEQYKDIDNDIYKLFFDVLYDDFLKLIQTGDLFLEFNMYSKFMDSISLKQFFMIFSSLKGILYELEYLDFSISMANEINQALDDMYISLTMHKIDEIFPCSKNCKDIKNEMEKQDKKILRLTRMAQMGEMISMIAHQWRQPLNNISMIVSTKKIELELNNIKKEDIAMLDEIASQVKYLSYTIDDFRNFFNPNKLKNIVNLNEVIDKSLSIISPSLEFHSIEVIKDYHFKKTIYTYSNELIQVVLNILKNAQDALVSHKVAKPMIIIIGYDNEDNQMIEILDNGGGIDPLILENIFMPYFTTKNEEEGTGLGLSLAKKIIEESCNGKLEVENIPNEGVKFTIILPLNEKN